MTSQTKFTGRSLFVIQIIVRDHSLIKIKVKRSKIFSLLAEALFLVFANGREDTRLLKSNTELQIRVAMVTSSPQCKQAVEIVRGANFHPLQ